MGRKADGAVFFFVDSEPPGSEDYSTRQVFEEVSAVLLGVFDTRAEAVEGPVGDRCGHGSRLVPLSDAAADSPVSSPRPMHRHSVKMI
jgi:hypothetical protein